MKGELVGKPVVAAPFEDTGAYLYLVPSWACSQVPGGGLGVTEG